MKKIILVGLQRTFTLAVGSLMISSVVHASAICVATCYDMSRYNGNASYLSEVRSKIAAGNNKDEATKTAEAKCTSFNMGVESVDCI